MVQRDERLEIRAGLDDSCRFATRRRAGVEHPLTGLEIEIPGRELCVAVLNRHFTCIETGYLAGRHRFGETHGRRELTVEDETDVGGRELFLVCIRFDASRVYAQPHGRVRVVGIEYSVR